MKNEQEMSSSESEGEHAGGGGARRRRGASAAVDDGPPHHLRRPMNAFLIFCKRHRSVVKEMNQKLENRLITKILGEWWKNLEMEEMAYYKTLADQYKDAFFIRNPDFKWYKLPAPPLRNIKVQHTRTQTRTATAPATESCSNRTIYNDKIEDSEKTNNNSTIIDFNRKSSMGTYEADLSKPQSVITPGKLADEAQMGDLSSLFFPKEENKKAFDTLNGEHRNFSFGNHYGDGNYETANRSHYDLFGNPIQKKAKEERKDDDSIKQLQDALTETTRVFKESDTNRGGTSNLQIKDTYTCDKNYSSETFPNNNNNFTQQQIINQVVDQTLCLPKEMGESNAYEYRESISSPEDVCGPNTNKSNCNNTSRSERACKGKRYQEFMAFSGLYINKRQKRNSCGKASNYYGNPGQNPTCSYDESSSIFINPSLDIREQTPVSHSFYHRDHYDIEEQPADDENEIETQESTESDKSGSKSVFTAADFDLDAKIFALPSLSLEQFQQKKRDKISKKRSIHYRANDPPTKYEPTSPLLKSVEAKATAKELRGQISGSQKRKPRKISITRLDIGTPTCTVTAQSSTLAAAYLHNLDHPYSTTSRTETLMEPQPADLCALATLAEIASNTSKLD